MVITEIPWLVQKSRLVEKIAELLNEKKLPLVGDVRDESGQLVTTTFMDYTCPTAVDVPSFEVEHQETPWRSEEDFAIAHVPGRAILHRGRHRHGAHPITGGERYNLILWCGSSRYDSRYENEHVPGWCGWTGDG